MRFAWLLAWLLACQEHELSPKEQAKEKAFAAAVKATEEAKQALARLQAARDEHARAVAQHADVKEKLAEVRKQAAETIKQADIKLAELGDQLAKVVAKIEQGVKDSAELAKLQAHKVELEDTIAKIKQLETELEQANE